MLSQITKDAGDMASRNEHRPERNALPGNHSYSSLPKEILKSPEPNTKPDDRFQLPLNSEKEHELKVLIAFYSETGNTEKIARAIYQEASRDHEAHLGRTKEIAEETLSGYDLVFLGSPCHSTDLAAPVKRTLDALPDSPNFKLAGFFTHGCPNVGESFDTWASKCISSLEKVAKEKQIDFIGHYHCQGAMSSAVEEAMGKYFTKKGEITANNWNEYIEELRKHPDHEDLQKAKEFARDTLRKN